MSNYKERKDGVRVYKDVCIHHGKTEFLFVKNRKKGRCVLCNRKWVNTWAVRARKDNRKWIDDNFLSKGCYYCKLKKPVLAMQVEHIKPTKRNKRLSKNGILYNKGREYIATKKGLAVLQKEIEEKSVVPSCSDCNHVKMKTLDKGTPEGKRKWRTYLREVRKNLCRHPSKNKQSSKATTKRVSVRI